MENRSTEGQKTTRARFHLAERAVEDEGVLAASGPHELRQPRREASAGEVVRPRDVRLVAPLLIPSNDPIPHNTQRKITIELPNRQRRMGELVLPDVDDGQPVVPPRHRH